MDGRLAPGLGLSRGSGLALRVRLALGGLALRTVRGRLAARAGLSLNLREVLALRRLSVPVGLAG
ncbi:hypothetical protein [Actinokineospora iranica]|uniref:Uncharacterized protein n=1 Tax=Actinokineospora iranica TaxID=1271860 RepID=A0A1G6QIH8_9PSEU|nr:hypothetical protein [Actinokineospora iranica]SDC91724.1 hypothetical protein SAMN05216174_105293 [Actinokineospora iranica]